MKQNTFLVYEGKGLTSDPVIGIVSGFTDPSSNPKTGPMLQLSILMRDEDPAGAARHRRDESICGDCPLRTILVNRNGREVAERKCMIRPYQFPASMWHRHQRDSYPTLTDWSLLNGHQLRLGLYGDPAALPFGITEKLVRNADGITGYTHAWRSCDQRYRRLLMASVETLEDACLAQSKGWRTFRTLDASTAPTANEIVCPASNEAGKRTTCDECLLCNGSRPYRRNLQLLADPRKSIVIAPHGSGKGYFNA